MTPEEKAKRLNELKQQLAQIRSQMANQASAASQPSTGEDFGRGIAQGATFGLEDEATGLVGAATDPQGFAGMVEAGEAEAEKLRAEAGRQDPRAVASAMKAEGFSDEEIAAQLKDLERFQRKDSPDLYDVYRDRARRLSADARERSPVATGLGEAFGAIGTGGLAAGGRKGLGRLMGEGAAYGFGTGEGGVDERLKSALLGAGIAGGVGVGGTLARKGVKGVQRRLGRVGQNISRRAADEAEKTPSIQDWLRTAGLMGVGAYGSEYDNPIAQVISALGLARRAGSSPLVGRTLERIGAKAIPNAVPSMTRASYGLNPYSQ